MIPLAIPQMSGNEERYLRECVATNFVSSVGPFVDRFEDMVAQASGADFAIATSSGTTGLHAALTAVGVGQGDLVILPSLTFIASANAIAHCGATPWLFDITRESWSLDPQQLEAALTNNTERKEDGLYHKETGRRVAAMLPVYTLGLPADMDALVALAQKFDIPIVADSAAALGSEYNGRLSGILGADLTVYSFNGNKTVTSGGGGAIVGTDKKLCDYVRHLTTTARVGADYDHDVVGFNYRMTNIQAAVGCAQMEQLDAFVEAKRAIARRYNDELTSRKGVDAFPAPQWAKGAHWYSGVTIAPDICDVAAIRKFLRSKEIDARPFWKPVHLQAPFRAAPKEDMNVSDDLWARILILPCSTSLTEPEQTSVIEALNFYLDNFNSEV